MGLSLDRDAAEEHIKASNQGIFSPGFKGALGLYGPPDERQEKLEKVKDQQVQHGPG